MKKILILLFSCILCFGAVDVSQIISAEDQGSTTTSIDQNLSSNYDIANRVPFKKNGTQSILRCSIPRMSVTMSEIIKQTTILPMQLKSHY